jgi:hypothetical protein
MYSSYPALIHAFHGCDHELAEAIFAGHETLKPSQNSYDWLGHGIYFWENDHVRAYQYAVNLSHNPKSKVKFPAVVGATIDLGYCFNLLEADALAQLKAGYEVFSELQQVNELPMPKNKTVENGEDLLLRPLDCAVIQTIQQFRKATDEKAYDSVRGVFWEGAPLYEGAGFKMKNHIQVCIANPNCIKGYFRPLEPIGGYHLP